MASATETEPSTVAISAAGVSADDLAALAAYAKAKGIGPDKSAIIRWALRLAVIVLNAEQAGTYPTSVIPAADPSP